MSVPRHVAAAGFVCLVLAGCHPSGERAGASDETRGGAHPTPYVLEVHQANSTLIYYGAAHIHSPDDPQIGDIERRWNSLRPDFALNEGGDPPVEATREIAVGRHGEPGLLRWLANRDAVPIRSLDPTTGEEVAAARTSYTPDELKVFYILRAVMQDTQRAPEFRAAAPEDVVLNALQYLGTVPGLEGPPTTLAEFESACRQRAPGLTDWRKVPPAWFDPSLEPPPAFTNSISRALSDFRDGHMLAVLESALREHERVFAADGAGHVFTQEPELRQRFEKVMGPSGLLPPDGTNPTDPRVVISLLGKPLTPRALPEARRVELARKLIGYSERAAKPGATEDDFIWLGRTLAYLQRYHDAIDAFTRGLEKFPASYRLLRHRGHRYITTRQLDRAQDDLERAEALIVQGHVPDEVEPDGVPNRSGIPRSTTNTNIYYHLGLVYYLQGNFDLAAEKFIKCLTISRNDDVSVAALNWAYLSLRRAGQDARAGALLEQRLRPDMQILENDVYLRLCRFYHHEIGEERVAPVDPADETGRATTGYALAAWHALQGKHAEADAAFARVAASPAWASFGVIAAEADLAKMKPGR